MDGVDGTPLDVAALKPRAEGVLAKHWRHAAFRPGQWEAIAAVLEGRDVLAVLPTGGGKSLCYQLPALLQDGLTLVVSPLIALMQDQVAGLNARGIPAAFINSTLSARAIDQCWTDAEFGRYRLLYVAPERLQSDLFIARAERLNVRLIAVDEAHCVSEWGHHFRPSYLDIGEARKRLGNPPMVAVTATATPQVRQDVVEQLGLRSPEIIVKGFDRPNLTWAVFRQENKREKVTEVLKAHGGTGILYTATRRAAESWAEWLQRQGENAGAYHGGMPAEARAGVQEAWLRGELRIVVATNAFGMGIDKPDVRFVIHVDVPGSLEMYYQEAGRAGRDGQPSQAVLLWVQADEGTQRALLTESHPSTQDVQAVYDAVSNLAQVSIGSRPDRPIVVSTDAVARLTGFNLGKIKAAIDLLDHQAQWAVLPARKHIGHIRFLKSAEAVRRYADGLENASLGRFVHALLRTVHADAFTDWWEIDLRILERRTRLKRERLLRGLAFLKERGMVDWAAPGEDVQVVFNEPRQKRVRIEDRAVRRSLRRAEARLEDMMRYARAVTCRRHFLLAYFGEDGPRRCGNCDVCLGLHEVPLVTPDDEPSMRHILKQVRQGVRRTAWFPGGPVDSKRLDALVDWLVQEGYLRPALSAEETYVVTPKAVEFMEQWEPRT